MTLAPQLLPCTQSRRYALHKKALRASSNYSTRYIRRLRASEADSSVSDSDEAALARKYYEELYKNRQGGATATEGQNNSVLDLKKEIVSAVASLDRGFAATESQMELLDSLCQKLEAAGGPVTLSWSTNSMNHLDGRWRLIYTSGFATGSVGGRRPGPRYTDLPFTIGQVYQDISSTKAELDNIVELHWRASLASLPFVVDALNAQPPMVTARLRHSMEFVGPKQVQIVFEATEVKLSGGLSGWLDNVPAFTAPRLPEYLQPPPRLRAATFDVTYLDAEMRLSRGDRGELRIYLKGMI